MAPRLQHSVHLSLQSIAAWKGRARGAGRRSRVAMAAQQLVEMLDISSARAQELLRESAGDIDTAVALHFADPSGARLSAPQSPRCDRMPHWRSKG